jgi:hypothetical protein
MSQNKIPTRVLVIASIITTVIFYFFLYLASRFFPVWTGRTLTNEWIIVFISAVPILIVLAFMLAGNISKAKIAGIELEFDRQLHENLLDSFQLNEQVSNDFFIKGSEEDLERIIKDIARTFKRPIFLLVPLEGKIEFNIDFILMRRYIYRLSEVAPIQFIVFVGDHDRFLGFTTIDKFKALFPRYGLELFLEDLENERVRAADLPSVFERFDERDSISKYLHRLIYRQWNVDWNDNLRRDRFVRPADITRLGASDQKIYISTSPSKVYWYLMENNLPGIPVVNNELRFLGIVTKDRITQEVIKQLLEKSQKSEGKK